MALKDPYADELEALLSDHDSMEAPEAASTSYGIRSHNGAASLRGRRQSSDEELLDSTMAREQHFVDTASGFANKDMESGRFQGE